ncbi:MAG: tetratricopeptide repeat protein [Bacteriovoracaceae bacterium]|nr:tetratricopeptide repeat protein [Bacteriovoracaceae bacterium]
MSLKYRIRLENERVIGPFSEEEIGELFIKNHIKGTEQCQQFPIGDWKPLQSFSQLSEIINETIKKINQANAQNEASITSVNSKKVSSQKLKSKSTNVEKNTEKTEAPIVTFHEFKFGKDIKDDVNYEELEKEYKKNNPHVPTEEAMEETLVVRKFSNKVDNLDKTVVVRPKFEIPKAKNESQSVLYKMESPVVVEEKMQPTREELINEKTEFINLAQALPTINAQLSVSEVELDTKKKIEESLEIKRLKDLEAIIIREQAIEQGHEDDEIEIIEEEDSESKTSQPKVIIKKKKQKGMSIVAILAFLGIFYFFLQDEGPPKQQGVTFLEVKFPITADEENIPGANNYLVQARGLYSKGNYRARTIASKMYLNSLAQKFSDNEALGEIILTYAELLDNTRDQTQSASTLYKYVQLAESKFLSDHSVATGVALFFDKIGKYQTGIYTIKNYLRAGQKPTPKMLSYYLGLLVKAGEFVEARKVFETISTIPKKPLEAYVELALFQIANDKPAEAQTIILEGIKYFPSSVKLLLLLSDSYLKEQSIKQFEATLKKVDKLQAEYSPVYLAKYLQYMGYLAAFKNKNKEASVFFKKSLQIKESDELRSSLAKLEIGGDLASQNLILESKVIGLLKKSKEEFKNRNLDSAFQFIIEAVDADPDYIPSVLFQAKLNTYRGFFESSIFSLQEKIGVHQQNFQLKKALVEVYIQAYKFDEAERLLSEIAQTKYATSSEYASLMGFFSEAKKNPIIAIKWYDRALSRDPLSDENMYQIAKILVKNKRFAEARGRISKALLLDPKNVKYHALNAEILYDQDGTDTALGYLRDTMTELGEDPLLVSTITSLYFRSGQIKEFQDYYTKIQNLPKKDEGLYEVLMAAAKLEGRKDEYVKHAKDLVKLNPGNLNIRMELGEVFLNEGKFDDAIVQFTEIKDKLESYPKVHYQLARVYLARNNTAKAREMATKELQLNPNLDSAHFIMGEVFRLEKDYREAILKYEKAISLNPRSIDALLAMANLKLQQNYANEAIDLLLRALKEDMTNPMIHKLLGDSYRAAGRRALAKEKYEDYLKLSPVAPDKDLIESLIRSLK